MLLSSIVIWTVGGEIGHVWGSCGCGTYILLWNCRIRSTFVPVGHTRRPHTNLLKVAEWSSDRTACSLTHPPCRCLRTRTAAAILQSAGALQSSSLDASTSDLAALITSLTNRLQAIQPHSLENSPSLVDRVMASATVRLDNQMSAKAATLPGAWGLASSGCNNVGFPYTVIAR